MQHLSISPQTEAGDRRVYVLHAASSHLHSTWKPTMQNQIIGFQRCPQGRQNEVADDLLFSSLACGHSLSFNLFYSHGLTETDLSGMLDYH